ncbi:SUF system NifU family Fe-S cluster assembly protein [Corynebacterium sp. MC-04]|uniref:SUF system NifU family Fe-S cluster assembly protein n=2 Tax=Corynebacterium parakroppenstedtii TaxID=2828363 RepID=A0ABS9HJI9_9CORY|nr:MULTISPECIES: SUF system NifU family Fe-S cluster assembly protein [Corynebacterium]KXB51544.1 SUF system FeS assembly protein, NifU family [Corynebacterium kroppenstedtii]MBY0787688.1 SUF system NifU family Fe-S cluster assembly protein [Corynebacterium parakroppenstedtii]MBY0791761.1 SUF system NifU family Fe-S cluster assembly protein [Corynebacterium parakroppenstedtii]MBY0794482.1 SUF system NifU family Fe-S cluster assembly protein [Corynebacterium parakroppenstedtii]MBY0796481.1 SUF 
MRLESMYQEVILDHYKNPQHAGLREPFDAEVHHVNTSCGDEITLRVQLSDDGSTIQDISYEASGCSISQASTSVMAEELIGQSVDDASKKLAEFERMVTSRGQVEGDEDLIGDGIAFAGVAQYPARVKCALLAWKALQAAATEAMADAGHDKAAAQLNSSSSTTSS